LLGQVEVRSSLLYLQAQVVRPSRPQPLPRLLQRLSPLAKVEPFAETNRLGQDRPDFLAQGLLLPCGLRPPLRLIAYQPHPAAGRQPHQGEKGHQQRRPGRVATAPAPGLFRQAGAACQDGPVVEEAAQVLGQRPRCLVTVGRLPGHRLVDDGDQVTRQVWLQPVQPRRLRRAYLPGHLRLVLAGKGRLQGKHFVEGRAEGVDVAADVGLTVEALRGQVTEGAEQVA
jgi:hypothetical protein